MRRTVTLTLIVWWVLIVAVLVPTFVDGLLGPEVGHGWADSSWIGRAILGVAFLWCVYGVVRSCVKTSLSATAALTAVSALVVLVVYGGFLLALRAVVGTGFRLQTLSGVVLAGAAISLVYAVVLTASTTWICMRAEAAGLVARHA